MMRQALKVFLTPLWYIQGGFRCTRAQFKYFWKGKRMASFEVQNERRSICETCPFREELNCGECGCFIQEKVEIGESTCPIGEW